MWRIPLLAEEGWLRQPLKVANTVIVHANVSLPAHQRAKLENLCRYVLRPPLAVERLERLPGGRLAYRMKAPWRDGTTHVIMSGGELVEKLAALVPAPRFHLVRYFGILASAAKQRSSIVPVPPVVRKKLHPWQ